VHLPTNLSVWLKLIGALTVGAGSILLAWRVKTLVKWIIYCLVVHENSIDQLVNFLNNQGQTKPVISGLHKHLLDVESRLGLRLMIAGFLLLGVGMLCNAASFLFG